MAEAKRGPNGAAMIVARSSSNWSISLVLGARPCSSRAANQARVISRSSPSMASRSRMLVSLWGEPLADTSPAQW